MVAVRHVGANWPQVVLDILSLYLDLELIGDAVADVWCGCRVSGRT